MCRTICHGGFSIEVPSAGPYGMVGLVLMYHPPDHMACTFSIEVGSGGPYAMVGLVLRYHPPDYMP